jgi:hypothetical protein
MEDYTAREYLMEKLYNEMASGKLILTYPNGEPYKLGTLSETIKDYDNILKLNVRMLSMPKKSSNSPGGISNSPGGIYNKLIN